MVRPAPLLWATVGLDGTHGGAGYTGAVVASLQGTLEGLGHTINTLTINASSSSVGLIGRLNGSLRDIGLLGGSVTAANYVGSLVGVSYGEITGVFSTARVSGTGQDIGGLVGVQDQIQITQAYATGAVSGAKYVGGLVGYQLGATIENTYAAGTVSSSGNIAGGLVGYLGGGLIIDSRAAGAVSGGKYAGGLVGFADHNSIIDAAYATGAVKGSNYVGGLIGSQSQKRPFQSGLRHGRSLRRQRRGRISGLQ